LNINNNDLIFYAWYGKHSIFPLPAGRIAAAGGEKKEK
jgi:hypothetical protein